MALVLVPARRADTDDALKLTKLLSAAFARRKIERARLTPTFEPGSLARGASGLEEARRELRADHALQRAAEHHRRYFAVLRNLKGALGSVGSAVLAETWTGMAAALLAKGDREEAERTLLAAIDLRPGMTENDFFGTGNLRELFRDVTATAHLRKEAPLRVESKPAGAEVWIGDELMGKTPLTLRGQKEGTKLVRLRLDGYYSHGWISDLRSERTTKLSHTLKPAPGRAAADKATRKLRSPRSWRGDAYKAQAAALDLKRLMGATDLVVATVKKTKTGWTLEGAVAAKDDLAKAIDLELAADAELLKRIDVLTFEWAP